MSDPQWSWQERTNEFRWLDRKTLQQKWRRQDSDSEEVVEEWHDVPNVETSER